MKNIRLIFIFLCFNIVLEAQIPEYILPLYVSDSEGNKDTAYIGYDTKAEYGFSEGDFGEKYITYDEPKQGLEVRFARNVPNYENQKIGNLPFMSKRFFQRRTCVPNNNGFHDIRIEANLYFYTKNLPITVSWDLGLIDKNCVANSFFHRLSISNVQKNTLLADRFYLRDKGQMVLTKAYMRDASKDFDKIGYTPDIKLAGQDTIYGMKLYLLNKDLTWLQDSYFTGTDDIMKESKNLSIAPNPVESYFNVRYEGDRKISGYKISTLTGQLLATQKTASDETNFVVSTNDFEVGSYLFALYFDDGSMATQRFVKLE
jgi:hypothetical protein